MKTFLQTTWLLIWLAFSPVFLPAQQVLYDNGPIVTHPGGGPGGADFSYLASPLSNYGLGNQSSSGNRLADDFTVTGDIWHIDSIVFYEYQTGSTTVSTFTATNLQISQAGTSNVVWGDYSTNRLQHSSWSNCYRGSDFSATNRPIMRNCCVTPSLALSPGNYILDWQASGSLSSGPWVPPITIVGQYITGNAESYNNGAWHYVYGDSTGLYQPGLPFTIYGHAGTPTYINISNTYTFSDPYNVASYKIIGLPGWTNFSLASVVPGTPNQNWTAFWDNGQATNYMKTYDGSSTFNFKPGVGFWVTSESTISINKNVIAVSRNVLDQFQISVNAGWTIISNPFDKNVYWSDIKTANTLASSETLWDWNGSWGPATILQPGKGYYYNYPYSSDFFLLIPYPVNKSIPSNTMEEAPVNGLILALQDDTIVHGKINIVFDENSSADFDNRDVMIPPGDFEVAGIRILAPQLSTRYKELYTESRPYLGDGQCYQVQLKNQFNRPLQLNCTGFENLPGEEVWLVSNQVNHHFDLKSQPSVEIPSGTETYTLMVGSKSFLERQTSQLYAGRDELFMCYPNPIRAQATIGYSVTSGCHVNIGVFDIAGKRVRQLLNGTTETGYHEVVFNVSGVAPGIYLCRMTATTLSGETLFTKVIRLEVMR